MTLQETVDLLTICAVYDSRKPSYTVAQQWAADLADVSLAEAAAAVREHYTVDPDTRVKAGHVLAIVKRHRRRRLDRSWLAEARALRASDADDVARFLTELRRARHGITIAETVVRPALPAGRYDGSTDQTARNARGKAVALAAIRTAPCPSGSKRDAWAELRAETTIPDELITEPEASTDQPPSTTDPERAGVR